PPPVPNPPLNTPGAWPPTNCPCAPRPPAARTRPRVAIVVNRHGFVIIEPPRIGGLLGSCFGGTCHGDGDRPLEGLAGLLPGDDRPIAADEEVGRDLLDAVGRRDVATALAIEHVGPGHAVFDQEPPHDGPGRLQLLDVLVHRVDIDAQDYEAPVAVRPGEFL